MMNYDGFKITHLAGYGFSPEILATWTAAGLDSLLPLQAQTVMTTGLMRGANVLALGPTSAGKTFIGELAAVSHWQAGRKTIFLSPTRALVAEQYRRLKERYEPLGIRVAMATAEHTRDDARIRRGEFDFGVMVYEKLRAFLVSWPDLLYSVGAVIADELQILGEGNRGETADLLLTRLTRAEPRVQVIGLSAVVDNGDRLADWLDAELVSSEARPSELREGVYCMEHQVFHYQCQATSNLQDESVVPEGRSIRGNLEDTGCPGVIELCTSLARQGESCLVFVPTRAMSRQFCKAIAAELGIMDGHSLQTTWQELQESEATLSRRQLLECVPAGVAFHNSDLTSELRGMVEQAFNAGQLRVVVATPTLAQGVNLKAKNVIQVPLMLRSDIKPARVNGSCIPLSVSRYRNQAGRAGRIGAGLDYGRSIVIAHGHMEASRLIRTYLQSKPEPITRTFSEHSMEQFVLECVQSGLADTYTGIHKALEHTFAWHCGAVVPGNPLDDQLAEAIRSLLDLQLLDETNGHRMRSTGSGQAMAAGGFQSATMRELMAVCHEWKDTRPGLFEILCACSFSADGQAFPFTVTPAEMKSNLWRKEALKAIENEGGLRSESIRRMVEPAGGMALSGHSSLKKAVIAHAWISMAGTGDLEERFRVVAGTMATLASHLAWIAGGLGAVASVLQCAESLIKTLESMNTRLPMGLSSEASGLAHLQIPGLTRCYINSLAREGYGTPLHLKTALRQEDLPTLEQILPRTLIARLVAVLQGSSVEPDTTEPPNAPDERPPCIELTMTEPIKLKDDLRNAFHSESFYDLILDSSDPGFVRFYGKELRLPPKPYALLTLLAQRCGHTVSYRDIDEIVWPDEKVEPQQISAHKSTLIRELTQVSSRERAESAIVTETRYGLRLSLIKSRVSLAGDRTKCLEPRKSIYTPPDSTTLAVNHYAR